MTPQLLLSLWRDRWGKTTGSELLHPYVQGKVSRWAQKFSNSQVWKIPGLSLVSLLTCGLFVAIATSLQISGNSQIVFSFLLTIFAIYARRHKGDVISVMIVGLSFIASARYFYWRLNTTLDQQLTLDFIFGFALCIAEIQIWGIAALQHVERRWPLIKSTGELPAHAVEWPSIDLLVLVTDQSKVVLEEQLQGFRAHHWPQNKLFLHVLANIDREEIRGLAQSKGVTYHHFPHYINDNASAINTVLNCIGGDLVAVVEGSTTIHKDFMQSVTAWFIQDTQLAMLHTPDSRFAPPQTELRLEEIDRVPPQFDIAIFRRSALIDAGGLAVGPTSPKFNTVFVLQTAGYGCASVHYLKNEPTGTVVNVGTLESIDTPRLPVVRIDHPRWRYSLALRVAAHNLARGMNFYRPLPHFIFVGTPLFFLLFQINPIHTSGILLAAYGIPHWLLGQLAHATLETRGRLNFSAIIRHEILTAYLLIRTTKSFLITELRRCRIFANAKSEFLTPPRAQPIAYLYGLGICLHLFAAYVSVMRHSQSNAPQDGMTSIYYLWTVYSVMLLIATIAIHKESELIRWTSQQRSKIPAMIKLPSHHLISCITSNFPALKLQCTLPTPVILEVGAHVSISIFRGYHEHVFTAQVVALDSTAATLAIDQAVADQYQALGRAVYSREATWPQWLPNQYSDRLMPSWAQKLINLAQSAFYNLITRSAFPLLMQRLQKWVLLGNKKNG